MNRAEAGNEDLSSFIDGDFVQDWTLELPLDGALQSESLTTPIDFSSHSSPPFGVLTPMDSSSFFLGSSNLAKDCFSRTPILVPYPEVTTGVDSLTSPFLIDPLLDSVPDIDALTEDRRVLQIHRDRSFGLEPENSPQNSTGFTDYSNCFIGGDVGHLPYSLESSNSQFQRSRTNESDSNSSQESNFQISETMLNSQNPAEVVSKFMVFQNQSIRPSTVRSPVVLGTRTLAPSLLDSNQEELTNKTEHPGDQKSSQGMILMEPLTFQSTPQMKLPSLPKISAPTLSSPWTHGPTGPSLGRYFENRPQTSIRLNPLSTGYGLFQSLQSTSDGSCVSTITSGEIFVSGKTVEEKSSNSNKTRITTTTKLTPEERYLKILRYKQKRINRRFNRGVTYHCRKTLADSRPRVRGRFAKNDDINAIPPKQKISKSTIKR